MTMLYVVGKYLLLIPIVAIATYISGNAPVFSLETGNTIGLSFGTWLLLFAVAATLTVLFLFLIISPTQPTGGLYDHKELD